MQSLPAVPWTLQTAAFAFVAPFLTGYWVYRDARTRGSEWAWQWAVGAVLFVLPVVPVYLFARRRLAARAEWRPSDRAAGTLAAALYGGYLLAVIVSPPDPLSQLPLALALSGVLAVVGHAVAVRWVPVRSPTQ